jgi:predicted outer membrane protein
MQVGGLIRRSAPFWALWLVAGIALVPGLVAGSGTGSTQSRMERTAAADDGGTTQTPWGPLTAADRDLVIRVRWAGLWEGPVGQMAQTHASSPVVKDVGAHLKVEHTALDVQVRAVAAKLGMALPDEPNPDQQAWMAELDGLRGSAFDQRFVERLRMAHGKVFEVIAQIRAGTQNTLVRSFSNTAVKIVSRHMAYLESTGLVNSASLPSGTGTTVKSVQQSVTGPRHTSVSLPLVLGVVAAVGIASMAIAVGWLRHPM